MPIELVNEQDRSAFGTEFVLGHMLAFLQKMLLNLLHFDDLLTFPTTSEHRTLLPVVNINRFFIENWVLSAAESASIVPFCSLIASCCTILVSCSIVVLLITVCVALRLFGCLRLLGCRLFRPLADVCLNSLLPLRLLWLLWLLCWQPLSLIDLGELGHQGIQRRLSESLVVFGYLITAKHSVELAHAIISRHSYIVLRVTDSLDSILGGLDLLVMGKMVAAQHLVEGHVLGDDLLTRQYRLLALRALRL